MIKPHSIAATTAIGNHQPANRTGIALPGDSTKLYAPVIILAVHLSMVAAYLTSGDPTALFMSNGIGFLIAAIVLVETKDIFHPFALFPGVYGMYSVLPLVSYAERGGGGDEVLATFGIEGGAVVFSAGTLGIILSWLIHSAHAAMKRPERVAANPGARVPALFPWLLLTIGMALNLMFFFLVGGFAHFSTVDYLERFQLRLTPGMGIFTHGTILTTLSLALFLSQTRINWRGIIAAGFAFLVIFAAYGERKYLIIPALMCVATYHYRIRKLPITATIILFVILYFVFDYIGFVRVVSEGGAISDAPTSIRDFTTYLADHFGSDELAPIFGTASAAYLGFVEPLPGFKDYLSAWQMAIPQFITTQDFISVNERFALAFNPESSFTRMGWGFSLFGEAYMVMGIVGPVLIAMCFCTLSVSLYRMARAAGFQGIAGALWLTLIYYQVWVQRNSFSHFFKDWFVYQVIALVAIAAVARLMNQRREIRLLALPT